MAFVTKDLDDHYTPYTHICLGIPLDTQNSMNRENDVENQPPRQSTSNTGPDRFVLSLLDFLDDSAPEASTSGLQFSQPVLEHRNQQLPGISVPITTAAQCTKLSAFKLMNNDARKSKDPRTSGADYVGAQVTQPPPQKNQSPKNKIL